jgi:hypothetical protein
MHISVHAKSKRVLLYLLTFLDVVAAGILVLGHFGVLKIPLLYVALYLAGKLLFWRDFFSIVDALAAVYFVFVFFGHASTLTWLFLVYFLYKFSTWLFGSLAN